MSEELTLLPCPACGGRAWVHYEPTTIRIYCPCCDILGPQKNTIEEARAAWNALPRALEWTTEPPKVPGRYWYRHKPSCTIAMINVDVEPIEYESLPGQWAGPIPEPCEPKE